MAHFGIVIHNIGLLESSLGYFLHILSIVIHNMELLDIRKLETSINPSKIESDLTNGPLSKLLELLDTQV